MSKKAIVLLSGGLDSAAVLYIARKQGYACRCLIFDYGQRHRREIAGAKRIASGAGCAYRVIKIVLPWKGSSLLDRKMPLSGAADIPSTYVPARNIIFLSFALSYAEAENAEAIFIGAHTQDYSGYPDCRPDFFRAFRVMAGIGTKRGAQGRAVSIRVPLLGMGKAGIIRRGAKLGVPFSLTWSCYRGGKRPCGKCESCRFRAQGFKEAGIEEAVQHARQSSGSIR